jgi:hypothetical protein
LEFSLQALIIILSKGILCMEIQNALQRIPNISVLVIPLKTTIAALQCS